MYKCVNCAKITTKWSGQCPQCNQWGSLEETHDVVLSPSGGKKSKNSENSSNYGASFVKAETHVPQLNNKRLTTGFNEVDRAIGSGVLPGAVVLVGGDPGIGKSTLLLQILNNIALEGPNVAYISGEESIDQLMDRAKRIIPNKIPDNVSFLAEVNVLAILQALEAEKFDFIVIDSLHAMIHPEIVGMIGGVSQLKIVASLFTQWAKRNGVGVFLIGQVTKTGNVAGPKSVEHIVDTVVYLEKIGIEQTRLIRTVKNRFGEVGEIGLLDMSQEGFKDKKDDIHHLLLSEYNNLPGGAFGITIQGSRPMAVQVQALLNDTQFSLPRRVVEGVSKNKAEVLAAVISKKIPRSYIDRKDFYIKVIGGVVLKDSGIDLAVIAALLSSSFDVPLPDAVFIGEVGLLGEVKSCTAFDLRFKEAKRLGFKKIYSHKNIQSIKEIVSLFDK